MFITACATPREGAPRANPMPIRALQLAALFGTLVMPPVVALAAMLAPAASGPVAAVFPPWWAPAHSFAAAGAAGPVIRFGAFRFIVIVAAADREILADRGAWLLLDPRAVGGCAHTPS